jgi:imidazolonepropionase
LENQGRIDDAMSKVELIVHNIGQVVTCAADAGPKRGAALADVGILTNGAVAVDTGRFVAVGAERDICARFTAAATLDAGGRAVIPGLVDCHTHLVYGGDRVAEFEQRVGGATYMEILAAGGGILSTMYATRQASLEQLEMAARQRLDRMLALGATTVEAKSGYGLDTATELKMLQVLDRLAGADGASPHPVDLVPTFLGAHALPPEFSGRRGDYLDLVVEEMLPAAMDWYRQSPFAPPADMAEAGVPFFCDVFCEDNVFDRQESARVLRAGQALGMPAKIHADEFTSLGGAALAVELGAVSADHLDVTPTAEVQALAASDTVAVFLPAVNFNLGSHHFADVRSFIDAGAAVALSTDLNPGSAPCPSLPLVMAIATRYQRMTPAEALNAVSINAAYALRLGDRLGSIQVGKQADFLILETDDYRHVSYSLGDNLVAQVIKRGRIL